MVVAVRCLSCRNYFVRMYVGCPSEFRVGMLECGGANVVKQNITIIMIIDNLM